MKRMNIYSSIITGCVMIVLIIFARQVFWKVGLSKSMEEQDIYYSFIEGQRLLNGENPYERILNGNMRENQKYATYFPLFYEFSYVTQVLGKTEFPVWLSFWKRVFLVFNWGTAILLFYAFWRSRFEWGGIFAAFFWLFNRWTLAIMFVAHLDFMPIFFLVASIILFQKSRWLSLLLFGVSLALKQIGIFILPLYLIWIWISVKEKRGKELLKAVILIGVVPFLSSIYFLIWNAEGFIKSVFFSVTRLALNGLQVPSLDWYMGWEGISGRLLMFVLFILIYWFSFTHRIGRYTGAFLIMSVFICFNTILFYQYMIWAIPLMLLLLLELKVNFTQPIIEA